MAAVNSKLDIKSFTYDFNVEGNVNNYKYAGVKLMPGEVICELRYCVLTPLTSVGGAAQLKISLGQNNIILYHNETIGTMNANAGLMASSTSNPKMSDNLKLRIGFNNVGPDYGLYFRNDTGDTLTGGRVLFSLIYSRSLIS